MHAPLHFPKLPDWLVYASVVFALLVAALSRGERADGARHEGEGAHEHGHDGAASAHRAPSRPPPLGEPGLRG